MKRTKPIAVATFLMTMLTGMIYSSTVKAETSSLQPQEITRSQASNYEKIGNITVSQHGFEMDNEELRNEVAEKGGKYYVIIAEQGQENHKTIEANIYK
ncbi:YdgH/BhsA/McbA-like domain containing protein [Citrobacter braakii]